MTYVLILYLGFGYGAGLTSTPFNSKEACEAAKEEIVSQWEKQQWGNRHFALCVAK